MDVLMMAPVAVASGVSLACFATLVLVALVGYPSLQYDPRHYFHPQALPIVAIVLMRWAAGSSLVTRMRRQPAAPRPERPVLAMPRVVALTGAIALGVTIVPATALRAYQAGHVTTTWSGFLAVVIRQRRDGKLFHEVTVPTPGVSVVVILVTEIGTYIPEVASAALGRRRALRFHIDRLGVVRAGGRVATGHDLP